MQYLDFMSRAIAPFRAKRSSLGKGRGERLRVWAEQSDDPAMSLARRSLAVWSAARPLGLVRGLVGEPLASGPAFHPAFLPSHCLGLQ